MQPGVGEDMLEDRKIKKKYMYNKLSIPLTGPNHIN
jgi:hypothetical protein